MQTTNTVQHEIPTQDEIARAAYLDWLGAGKPAGCDHKFWLEAEARLRNGKTAAHPPAPTPMPLVRRTPAKAKAK
jgi:hypothetical protein